MGGGGKGPGLRVKKRKRGADSLAWQRLRERGPRKGGQVLGNQGEGNGKKRRSLFSKRGVMESMTKRWSEKGKGLS